MKSVYALPIAHGSAIQKSEMIMNPYVLSLSGLDKTKIPVAGGKGANLGELLKIDGISVPGGFCVTTEAFKEVIENNEALKGLLEELAHCKMEDRHVITKLSGN